MADMAEQIWQQVEKLRSELDALGHGEVEEAARKQLQRNIQFLEDLLQQM